MHNFVCILYGYLRLGSQKWFPCSHEVSSVCFSHEENLVLFPKERAGSCELLFHEVCTWQQETPITHKQCSEAHSLQVHPFLSVEVLLRPGSLALSSFPVTFCPPTTAKLRWTNGILLWIP